jgi:hypothetical protein
VGSPGETEEGSRNAFADGRLRFDIYSFKYSETLHVLRARSWTMSPSPSERRLTRLELRSESSSRSTPVVRKDGRGLVEGKAQNPAEFSGSADNRIVNFGGQDRVGNSLPSRLLASARTPCLAKRCPVWHRRRDRAALILLTTFLTAPIGATSPRGSAVPMKSK